MLDIMYGMCEGVRVDPILDRIIRDLRHPMVDVADSEAALAAYIKAEKATAFYEGAQGAMDLNAEEWPENPYGEVPDCTCGYGGVHEPHNPCCARTQHYQFLINGSDD